MTGARASTTARPPPLLGMTIFIASWAMLFASLFFAYGLTRAAGAVLAAARPAAAAAGSARAGHRPVAAGDGWRWSRRAGSRASDRASRCGRWPACCWWRWPPDGVPGAAGWWSGGSCWQAGLRPQTGTYASVFYGLTVFHGLHVLVGVGRAGRPGRALRPAGGCPAVSLRLWTLYLHMVAVLWAGHVRGGVPAVTSPATAAAGRRCWRRRCARRPARAQAALHRRR